MITKDVDWADRRTVVVDFEATMAVLVGPATTAATRVRIVTRIWMRRGIFDLMVKWSGIGCAGRCVVCRVYEECMLL